MSEAMPTLSRRAFVKTTGALGALAAVGGAAATDSLFGSGVAQASADSEEKVTWGHCAIKLPGPLQPEVPREDDEVVWVDTYTSKDADFDDPQPRACLRGSQLSSLDESSRSHQLSHEARGQAWRGQV